MIKKDKNLFRNDITGLRAIAVIAVVMFHLKISGFTNGYLGVDIFFVISGYLISQIIYNEIEKRNFSIKNFYIRRIKRLMPMVFFIILVSIPIFSHIMIPNLLVEFSKSVISVLFFYSNFFFFYNTDYFSSVAETKPLLHFWSLSIEIQFYILFPVFLVLIYRIFRKNLKEIILFFFLFFLILTLITNHSLVNNLNESWISTLFSFYFPFARIWELLLGSTAFFYTNNFKKYNLLVKNLLSISGLTLVLICLTLISKKSNNPDILNFIVTFGIFLILVFYDKKNISNIVLSNKIFLNVGLISYSLYLWHFLIISFFNNYLIEESFSLNIKLLIIFLSFLLSILSYNLIEKKLRFSNYLNNNLFKLSIFSIFIILISIFIIISKSGFINNFYKINEENELLVKKIYFALNNSASVISKKCNFYLKDINKINKIELQNCFNKNKKTFIILGDSHGQDLYNGISQNNNDNKFNLIGINIPKDIYNKNNNKVLSVKKFIKKYYNKIDGIIYHDSAEFFIKKRIDDKINLIEDICSQTINCYYLGPKNRPNINYISVLKIIKKNQNLKSYYSSDNEDKWPLEADKYLKKYKFENLKYISIINILKYNFDEDFDVDNLLTFSDGTDHWSEFGERYFGKKILDSLNNENNLF